MVITHSRTITQSNYAGRKKRKISTINNYVMQNAISILIYDQKKEKYK